MLTANGVDSNALTISIESYDAVQIMQDGATWHMASFHCRITIRGSEPINMEADYYLNCDDEYAVELEWIVREETGIWDRTAFCSSIRADLNTHPEAIHERQIREHMRVHGL